MTYGDWSDSTYAKVARATFESRSVAPFAPSRMFVAGELRSRSSAAPYIPIRLARAASSGRAVAAVAVATSRVRARHDPHGPETNPSLHRLGERADEPRSGGGDDERDGPERKRVPDQFEHWLIFATSRWCARARPGRLMRAHTCAAPHGAPRPKNHVRARPRRAPRSRSRTCGEVRGAKREGATATSRSGRGRAAHARQFSSALPCGSTMNGTTCSRVSNDERYEAAACFDGNGPTRTRYHVPRPATCASTT